MLELLRYHLKDGIATIALNNGKVNAISSDLLKELHHALDQAEAAGAIVVLTGQAGILSGGFDLKTMRSSPENATNLVAEGSSLTRRMLAHPQPIIVACSGHAVAKGAFLLLAADYRIGVEGAFTIGLNEVKIGMTMHHAGIALARNRLMPAAFERAVINSEMFNPQTAIAAGFLDEIVPSHDLLPRAHAVAEQFKGLNMHAHAATKRKVRKDLLDALGAAIALDRLTPLSIA